MVAQIRRRQEVQYAATGTLYCWPEVEGVRVDPSSGATVDVYRPGQSSPELASQSATEDADHVLSVSVTCTDTGKWTLGEGYVAVFKYAVGGVSHQQRVHFDIVRVPLTRYPPITVTDLSNSYKMVADAISRNSITNGNELWIIPAWEDILNWVDAQGRRPSLVSDGQVFAQLLHAKAMVKLCMYFANKGGDIWDRLEEKMRAEEEEAQRNLVLRYSEADEIANSQRDRSYRQPQLLIGPDRRGINDTSSTMGSLVWSTSWRS